MPFAYLSPEAGDGIRDYLASIGYKLLYKKANACVASEISLHPDIFLCKTGTDDSCKLIEADTTKLGVKYPRDIAYNALLIGRYLVHTLKYSAPEILAYARDNGFTEINVPQGYTKCSVAVVSDSAVITDDLGIASVLVRFTDIDVLVVKKCNIALGNGEHNGFIGGCSGLCGKELLFNGDLSSHPDYKKICAFAENYGVRVKGFDYELRDIGSLITSEHRAGKLLFE